MIYTFYSFKGGVGRSMAAANIAKWCYSLGLRVIMIDWDLEAPGLENFFVGWNDDQETDVRPQPNPETAASAPPNIQAQLGLIDMLEDYKRRFIALPKATGREAAVVAAATPEQQQIPRSNASATGQDTMLKILRDALPSIVPLLYPIHPAINPGGPGLWLLTAGCRGDGFSNYARLVQNFDWADFYASYEGQAYFEWLGDQLEASADVVIIDSRTGVSEMAGVCAQQLANVVVSFCAPNFQNLRGVETMVNSFTRQEIEEIRGRPLESVVVPTRVDNSEITARNKFEAEFNSTFIGDAVPAIFRRLKKTFWDLRIPYIPKYGYSEMLAIGAPDSAADLVDAYKNLAVHLVMLAPEGSNLRRRFSSEISRVFGRLLPKVFISCARRDGEEFATQLRKRLQNEEPEITLWQDQAEMEGGVGWWKQIEEALDHVRFLVIVMTPVAMQSEMTRKEWRYARQRGVNVYPVKGCPDAELDYASLPNWMRKAHFFDLDREWETFVNYLKSERQPARCVPFMAPDLPEGFVKRPREFEQLIAQLIEERRESPIASSTVLQGPGGHGKTTLAVALCHDDRIIGAFDDGILWVTLGQNPNVLGELIKLYEALTGEQSAFVDERQAGFKLRENLENRNCLLVIDDVWQRAHLEPFLQGGKQTCARLITTRRSDLVKDVKLVRVDEMTHDESVALLVTRVPGENRPRDLQPFRHLAALLMDWPLLLELAAGVIGARIERGDTLGGALDYAKRAYEKRGLTAFDPKDAEKRNDAVAKSLQASLDILDQDERTRLTELAIFPEHTDVPLHAVQLLWALDDLDTQDAARQLADYALLDLDLSRSLVRLHGQIRLYLLRSIKDDLALHTRLLDEYGKRCSNGWATGPDDGYFFEHLAYHLNKAGREGALRELLLDFRWMQAKLQATDTNALIADYDYLRGDEELRLIQSAIRLSAHVLARDVRQLAGQLTGRLLGNRTPSIQALVKQAAEWIAWCWLRPLNPSLTAPGGPLIRTLEGHTDRVLAVAVTPDGRRAVSGSGDRTLRLWDLESGQTIRTLEGHTDRVLAVAVTPDGRRAVSGSGDRTLRLWDLSGGQTIRTLEGHTDSVCAVAMTPDGRRAVSGSWDRTLRLWDLESGQTVRTLEGHTDRVLAVAVTPDGRRAVSGSGDRTLRLWDLESGQTIRTLEGHTDRVLAVAVTPDGHRAVSASYDRMLRVWDLGTGQTIHTLEGHTDSVCAVAMTPGGRRAVSGSEDRTLRLWDLGTGQTIRTLEGHTDRVLTVAVTPDGRRAVSGSWDRTLQLWDLEGGQSLHTPEGHTNRVLAMAVTPDGRRAVSGSEDRTLRLWDLGTGQTIRTLEGHTDRVLAVALNPEGSRAISASFDRTLRLWDLENGQTIRTFKGHTGRVRAVAVTSDGRRAVSGSGDRTLRLWDLEAGQSLRTLEGHRSSVTGVAITPDGRRAVSASDDNTLRLWDLEAGQSLRTLEGHAGAVRGVAVTPDGHRAVSASEDRTLRLWDLETGQTIRTFKGHTDSVWAAAVTPDGRLAVSGSGDRTLRLWDLESGKEIATFTGDSGIDSCAIVPDGQTIVAGDDSGQVHFLRLEGAGTSLFAAGS